MDKTKEGKKLELKKVLAKFKKEMKNKNIDYTYISIDDGGVILSHKNLNEAQKEKNKNPTLEFFSKAELL